MFNDCEMFRMKLCLGCVGLGEKDWVGKHSCETYNNIRKRSQYDNRFAFSNKTEKK